MATTACGDSKRPMGAVDDEHVNGGIDVWEPGTMALPQAPSPDISVTRPGRMNRLGDHPPNANAPHRSIPETYLLTQRHRTDKRNQLRQT